MFRSRLFATKDIYFMPLRAVCRTKTSRGARVRFAPSPTGYLHLGGLRTALYNYLFAKSRDGVFILRIEDTDQSRKVEGAVEALVKDLEWAGVEFGEGPMQGGKHGPYVQSERLGVYQLHITKLIDNGSAYRCFCTERRLNILRRDALKSQRVPKYDNRCRHLTNEQIKEKIKAGTPYCVRFKKAAGTNIGLTCLPKHGIFLLFAQSGDQAYNVLTKLGRTSQRVFVRQDPGPPDPEPTLFITTRRLQSSDIQSFDDMVYGNIAYDVSLTEGDPVLLKTDGYPTYHFANVVDDHLMGITHVLRGVEWQISTTKHLLMYRAFGWFPPQFGHLPLIVNSDGTKLSKRQSDVRVADYRNNGVFPLALVNFITLSGGGFDHVPGAGVRLKSMDELTQEFDIEKVSSHPTRLNVDLLEECNRLEIRRQLQDETLTEGLISKLQKLVSETYPKENLNVSNEHVKSVLHWALSRTTRIEDLVSSKFGFLWILPSSNPAELDKDLLAKLLESLETVEPFDQDTLKNNLREFSQSNNVKFPALMKMLRSALSGLNEGPGVAEMMHLLGKGQSLERIKAVVR